MEKTTVREIHDRLASEVRDARRAAKLASVSEVYVAAVREWIAKLAIRCGKVELHFAVETVAADVKLAISQRQAIYCLDVLVSRGEISRERRRQKVDGKWQTTLTTIGGKLLDEITRRMKAFGMAVRRRAFKVGRVPDPPPERPHAPSADNRTSFVSPVSKKESDNRFSGKSEAFRDRWERIRRAEWL